MDQFRIDQLVHDVEVYAASHKGKIYAPICHPAFAHVPYEHDPERFEIIAPHIPKDARTALDIGTHWGFFAHKLEESGLKVTAAEHSKQYLPFLKSLKELYGDDFEIYSDQSVLDMPDPVAFDVVLALAIFHHFIKAERNFNQLKNFLERLNCKVMFLQPHNPKEGQMTGAYRNFNAVEFCDFVVSSTPNLSNYKKIGESKGRPIYIIS